MRRLGWLSAALLSIICALTIVQPGNAQIVVNPGSGGGGTFGGTIANQQVAFGTALNVIGGSSTLTFSNSMLWVGTNTETSAAIDNLFGSGMWTAGLLSQHTATTMPVGYINLASGLVVAPTADASASTYTAAWFGAYSTTDKNLGEQNGLGIGNTFAGTSTVDHLYGLYAYAENIGVGHVNHAYGGQLEYDLQGDTDTAYIVMSRLYSRTGGTLDNGYGVYVDVPERTGTVTNYMSFWSQNLESVATNAYHFWADEQGVYRIRSDGTFNSVVQAIPALYNPQFTKYTPGATNHERCVPGCQWESNVAVITTEKGGTGTLRDLRLGDAGVRVIVGSAPVAVASLPTCDSSGKGARATVTDANATTFLSTVAGSGANNVPVFCDGTNWKIG